MNSMILKEWEPLLQDLSLAASRIDPDIYERWKSMQSAFTHCTHHSRLWFLVRPCRQLEGSDHVGFEGEINLE